MKKVCFLVLFSIVVFVAGCAPGPSRSLTAEEQRYLSTGPGPIPDDYQEIVRAYMDGILIDPESARYSGWRVPKRGTVQDYFGRYVTGWKVCAEVNAKNRFGGYTGKQLHFFLIHGGKVVVRKGGHRPGTVGEQDVCKLCEF
jgi:hypothetical protein